MRAHVSSTAPSGGEDLAQRRGERVRLARVAVFAASEPVVAAGKGDRLDSELVGHCYCAARPAMAVLDCSPTPMTTRVDAARSAS